MKIQTKDLQGWVKARTTVRHCGVLYKANYNGNIYFLLEVQGKNIIPFYKTGRGVYGLESNRAK